MKFFKLIICLTFVGTVFTSDVNAQEGRPGVENSNKKLILQNLAVWSNSMSGIFMQDSSSSNIGEERRRKMNELNETLIRPLGVKALTYLVVAGQTDHYVGRGIYSISKFVPHNVIIKRLPKNLLSTTEEFSDLIETDLRYDASKVWLRWWLEGKERTPVWFAERYPKWIDLKQQGKEADAKVMYQKLLDIGLPAIPLWLEKLNANPDAATKQAIGEALSYLTDGDVKAGLTEAEYSAWWKLNQDKWTIPFPQSKLAYVAWLEKEASSDDGLGVAYVTTLSRIEEPAAIDALVRLLKHPKPEVRAQVLEQLQKLLGEQLPEEYRLGIETDKWENLSDLQDLNKYETARKALADWQIKMNDKAIAEKTAGDLAAWWKANNEKAVIHWPRAWQSL